MECFSSGRNYTSDQGVQCITAATIRAEHVEHVQTTALGSNSWSQAVLLSLACPPSCQECIGALLGKILVWAHVPHQLPAALPAHLWAVACGGCGCMQLPAVLACPLPKGVKQLRLTLAQTLASMSGVLGLDPTPRFWDQAAVHQTFGACSCKLAVPRPCSISRIVATYPRRRHHHPICLQRKESREQGL